MTHKLKRIPPELQATVELAKENVLPVYARPDDVVISHAEGSHMYAVGGLKYLDFSAGIAVNSLGHADKGYLEVILILIIQSIIAPYIFYRSSDGWPEK